MRTLSGAHEFDPAHVSAIQRAYVVSVLDSSLCPRCGGPLTADEMPAGSRATPCRCVPVCAECGADEAYEEAGIYGEAPSATFEEWPVDRDAMLARLAAIDEASTRIVVEADD